MNNYNLIKYKWENGVYKIEDMIQFVKIGILNKQQFFEITRYDYYGIKKIDMSKNL